MLPTFLIIGAMKAGTTSLYHYLRAHPDVYMSEEKEIHFFNREENWQRGPGWYEAFFSSAGSATVVGEASPGYSMYPHRTGVAERVAALLPDVKLIYAIRDPIERMRSHYAHRLATGHEVLPIDRELVENSLYLDMSRYAFQVDRYLAYFPRERIHFVVSERLRSDRESTMSAAFTFLGVDPDAPVPDTEFHRTEQRRMRTPLGRAAHRIPGYGIVRRLSPSTVKGRVHRALTAPAVDPATLHLSAETEALLESRLQGEVARLRDDFGVTEVDVWTRAGGRYA